MNENLGKLLKDCIKEAGIKQKELAQMIHVDGSVISRIMKGKKASVELLQSIVNALALKNIPREKLDKLLEAGGYYYSQRSDVPVPDPVVPYIFQEFENLQKVEHRAILSQDLRSIIELNQGYFSALKDIDQKRWEIARTALIALRDQVEQRLQAWYLRIDEELGRSNYKDGEYTEAVLQYESALWSAQQLNLKSKEGEILIMLGDTHRRRGGADWDLACERYEQARRIFEQSHNTTKVVDCLRRIGATYLYQGKPDKAEEPINDSLNFSYKANYKKGIYKGLQHQAWLYEMTGRWQEATQVCEEALEIVKDNTKDEIELALSLRYLGDAYRINREIEKAKLTYEQALKLLEKFGTDDKLSVGMIKLGLGKIYTKLPNKEQEAKRYLNESLEVHKYLGEDFRVADVLNEQGDLLLKMRRLKDAESRLVLASNFLRRLGNVFHYANTLSLLCELYYEMGDGDLQKVFRTANVARKMDDGNIYYALAQIEFIVGKAYIDQGQIKEAGNSFGMAAERAIKFNRQTFRELNYGPKGILSELRRATKPLPAAASIELAENYLQFLKSKANSWPTEEEMISKLIDDVQQIQMEIKTLTPI